MPLIHTLYPLLLEVSDPIKSRITAAIIALLLALLIAWLVTASWKSQLKSVRRENFAGHYVRKDSLVLHHQSDVFSHKHVDRSPRPKKDN